MSYIYRTLKTGTPVSCEGGGVCALGRGERRVQLLHSARIAGYSRVVGPPVRSGARWLFRVSKISTYSRGCEEYRVSNGGSERRGGGWSAAPESFDRMLSSRRNWGTAFPRTQRHHPPESRERWATFLLTRLFCYHPAIKCQLGQFGVFNTFMLLVCVFKCEKHAHCKFVFQNSAKYRNRQSILIDDKSKTGKIHSKRLISNVVI